MAQASSRGNPAMGDIVRSVAVLGVIVLALWGIQQFLTTTPDDPTSAVDYVDASGQVARVADFDVAIPERLPEGWRATSARFDNGIWHLGVLTATKDYVGLEQSRKSSSTMIKQFAAESTARPDTVIDGNTWRVRKTSAGDVVLLREHEGVTTLLISSAPMAELSAYVGSLTVASSGD